MSAVTDLIADARIYAGELVGGGQGVLQEAINAVQSLTGGFQDPFKSILLHIEPPDPESPGAVPTYDGPVLEPGMFSGTAPNLQQVGTLQLPADPVQPVADLVYVDPIQPSGEPDASMIGAPPTIASSFVIPSTPDLQSEIAGITKPTLTPIDIPVAPVFQPPEFTGVAPTFNAVAPTDLDQSFRDGYNAIAPQFIGVVSSGLDSFIDAKFPNFRTGLAAIEDRLNTYLAGGSALSPDVEDAMYNRALDRSQAEGKKALAEAMGRGARAGFSIMPATLLSQAQDIDQARRDNNVRAAVEIYVKQAELEQSNLQFAVKTSAELRKIAIDSALAYFDGLVRVNGQALEYARDSVEFVVKAFDIAAKYAETQARIYEADATVYRALLEGKLGELKAYESEIRALEAVVNVDRAQVETYRARIEAVKTEADVFRAAVDAVVAAAGLERIKVELYDARVKGYASQVNAYTARWEGYKAAVGGQSSKMQVNVERQRAYEASANAYSAIVRGRTAAIEAGISVNKNLLDQYKTQADVFATLEHSKVESVSLGQKNFQLQIDAYRQGLDALTYKNNAVRANYELGLRGLTLAAQLFIEEMKEADALRIKRAEGLSTIAVALGREYASVAAAALNGMNTLAAKTESSTV